MVIFKNMRPFSCHGKEQYTFIAITPRFTLIWSDSTCWHLTNRSNVCLKIISIRKISCAKKTFLINNYTKNVDMNLQWMWFSNLEA